MPTKPSMSINLGLALTPEVDSPELYSSLLPVYNAIRNVMYAVDAYTGNGLTTADEYSQINPTSQLLLQKTAVLYVQASEAISVGHMVNLWNSGGLRARKATNGVSRCHAYALASASGAGVFIPVCFFGLCTQVGSLTAGTEYYLSSTPGLVTSTVTAQRIGVALDSSKLWFTP